MDLVFFFKQKTAYEMRISDWSSDVCSSDLPVGVFKTHKDAPRVLIAKSNLVPKWATWEKFHELDRAGLFMYGQMTAGSWIYIGSQGIIQIGRASCRERVCQYV